MRAYKVVATVLACLLVAATVGWTQAAAEREIQTGLKTTGEAYAAQVELSYAMADIAKAKDEFPAALQKLMDDTTKAGLTPLGPGQIVIAGIMPPDPAGKITLEVQLPVIEQGTDKDLKGDAGVKLVKLPPTLVAYTFHKGGLLDLQTTFMRLFQWAQASGKEVSGAPTVIMYKPPTEDGSMVAELQLPVK